MKVLNEENLKESMNSVAEIVLVWLKRKDMFKSKTCPPNRRFMTDDEWEEFKDTIYNSILSF